MPDLPEVREKFVADTTGYSRPLREAAKDADKFASDNERAALAARKMGLAAKEAAEKAARAQNDAADAAQKLARGEIDVDEAANAAAKAERELERAAIKAAEAQRALSKAADTTAENMRQVARDAELAAAAERLGALKAAGASKQYNTELKALQKQHGSLAKTALSDFKEMENKGNSTYQALTSAGQKAAEAGPLWQIGIGNALAELPGIASVAAGGITLALGAAVAGVGVMFAAKNKEVRAEFSSLGHDIFSKLSADAQPFVGVLKNVANEGSAAFGRWEPEIKASWASMAPAVDKFIGLSISSLDKFQPALKAITAGFNAELGALGPRMGAIMGNIATGLKAIADAAAANPDAFAGLVEGLSSIVRYAGDAIGFLVRFKGMFDGLKTLVLGPGPMDLLKFLGGIGSAGSKLGALIGITGKAKGATSEWKDSLNGASTAATETGMSTRSLLSAQQAAALSSADLKTKLDDLTGANQNAFDAQTAYSQALNDANALAKKSNAGVDGSSKAILANRAALSQLAVATKQNIENGNLSAKQIEKQRQAFIKVAEGMGVSKKRAKELADEMLGVSGAAKKIPAKTHTDLTATDKTKAATDSAKKGSQSFSHTVYRASLTAINKTAGAIQTATRAADRFAGKAFRASLTAINKAGPAVSAAAALAKRFANGNYRALLTAKNGVVSAFNSAMSLGYTWASKTFSATFNVIKKLFSAGGGYVEHFAEGGSVQGFPTGGSVSGPGTATSDSIPAMLSDGEYVINAAQTKKHKALLDAINYGLDGFAKGGVASTLPGGTAKTVPDTASVLPGGTPLSKAERAAALVAKARARPEYLAALAAQQALASMRRSAVGGITGSGLGAGFGSGNGTVEQHVHVNVTVQGSVRADTDLARTIAGEFIKHRMPHTAPGVR